MVRPLSEALQGGFEPSLLELFEAVGFTDLEALAQAEPSALHAELSRANSLLKLAVACPSPQEVAGWVAQAKRLLEPAVAPVDSSSTAISQPVAVDYETLEQVQAMLANSPFALPLPARLLAAQRIAVGRIPKGLLLNCHVGDLEVRVSQESPMPRGARALQTASGDESVADLDWSRLRSAGEVQLTSPDPHHDVKLKRGPREATNAGKHPDSRWFIRGVLHPEPLSLYMGALSTLWVHLLLPCSLVAATLLLLAKAQPERYEWVPGWLVFLPVMLLPSGLAYLIWGLPGRCRVCSQKIFIHRIPHKHARSHRFPGDFGHVVALCLHLLVFRWFRCMHCGTSVRIKE